MAKDTKGKWAIGALILGIVGYIAGLLTAPKSGKENRKYIENTADRVVSEAERQLKVVHSELNVVIDKSKKLLDGKTGAAKEEIKSAFGIAKEKQGKVKDLLGGLRDGGSTTDPELAKALKEGKKALDHLKTFLK
jgi:gas vesicle protein